MISFKGLVKFRDYAFIPQLHAKVLELAVLEQAMFSGRLAFYKSNSRLNYS
jgi:hypothetical protein